MVVQSARNIDGTVKCPECDEACGNSELRVLSDGAARLGGGVGNLWAYIGVEHTKCGSEFEVGGQVGTTDELS